MERYKGTVFRGKKVGAEMVRLYHDIFQKFLGFQPYPGTLNLRLDKKYITSKTALHVDKKTVQDVIKTDNGGIYLIRCVLFDQNLWIVRPEMTDYDDFVVEVLSKDKLLEKYNLEEGFDVDILIEK